MAVYTEAMYELLGEYLTSKGEVLTGKITYAYESIYSEMCGYETCDYSQVTLQVRCEDGTWFEREFELSDFLSFVTTR